MKMENEKWLSAQFKTLDAQKPATALLKEEKLKEIPLRSQEEKDIRRINQMLESLINEARNNMVRALKEEGFSLQDAEAKVAGFLMNYVNEIEERR